MNNHLRIFYFGFIHQYKLLFYFSLKHLTTNVFVPFPQMLWSLISSHERFFGSSSMSQRLKVTTALSFLSRKMLGWSMTISRRNLLNFLLFSGHILLRGWVYHQYNFQATILIVHNNLFIVSKRYPFRLHAGLQILFLHYILLTAAIIVSATREAFSSSTLYSGLPVQVFDQSAL